MMFIHAFRSHVSTLLLVTVLSASLQAALVQTGNVEPDVTTWNFNTSAHIGRTTDGNVLVDAGSRLISNYAHLGVNSGVNGTALITGAGSEWYNDELFLVGSRGGGTLKIESGARVNSDDSYVGFSTGSTGAVTVSGSNSAWLHSGNLYVGSSGNGTLTVKDGAWVGNSNGYIGLETGVAVIATITGVGSTWNNSGAFQIGQRGFGTLAIEAGAQVFSDRGLLGHDPNAIGIASVSGTGSKWNNSSHLVIGEMGSATLSVTDGGEVVTQTLYASISSLLGNGTITATQGGIIDADLLFDAEHGSQAIVSFGSGGTLKVQPTNGTLGVGYRQSGSLIVTDGQNISTFTGYLGSGSGSAGTATVRGVGSEWNNSGSLYVGDKGSGALSISEGGLVTVGARLTIDTNLDGDSFINLTTGGMLALRGNYDDSLSQFLERVSGSDAICYWDASLSDWAPLTTATLGIDYNLSYIASGDLTGYTLLTVGRVGDFDNDGDVDGRDFLAWQRNPSLGSLADWQANFGSSESLANSMSVPEPGTCSWLACIVLLAFRTNQVLRLA